MPILREGDEFTSALARTERMMLQTHKRILKAQNKHINEHNSWQISTDSDYNRAQRTKRKKHDAKTTGTASSGLENGVISKGIFSQEESLESLNSLDSLESLENGQILLYFPQFGCSLESLESLDSLESIENGFV